MYNIEKLNVQDLELEALLAYDSTEDFSDNDRYNIMFKFIKLYVQYTNIQLIKIIFIISEPDTTTISESDTTTISTISEPDENYEESSSEIAICIGKTFQSWNHVAKFMKKYAAAKGHGVRIGGGGKVDKITKEVLKRTYLCRHAGKANSKSSQRVSSSCRVECPWKVNIWVKKSKGYLEVTTFNDQYIGHELHPLANRFVPMLRKLPKEILEEIRF